LDHLGTALKVSILHEPGELHQKLSRFPEELERHSHLAKFHVLMRGWIRTQGANGLGMIMNRNFQRPGTYASTLTLSPALPETARQQDQRAPSCVVQSWIAWC
jgi:hypothetical protein